MTVVCGTDQEIADGLDDAFGRVYSARTTDKSGNLVKMYAHPVTGEWSIVIVRPNDDLACVTMNGNQWEAIVEENKPI